MTFPPVPLNPTRDDALAALKVLERPLSEFPFVTPADKSAALSGILTPLDCKGVDIVPVHGFTAPEPGTGKGLLEDFIAMIATGRVSARVNFTMTFGIQRSGPRRFPITRLTEANARIGVSDVAPALGPAAPRPAIIRSTAAWCLKPGVSDVLFVRSVNGLFVCSITTILFAQNVLGLSISRAGTYTARRDYRNIHKIRKWRRQLAPWASPEPFGPIARHPRGRKRFQRTVRMTHTGEAELIKYLAGVNDDLSR